ncbi:hypothetical protein [Aliiroseovarius crassostreae]|uniref:hypothetical protein n=1 Tax=Aliiroseovarius crassostreae TaxID=154981 RepID=UPI003C7A47F5
MKQIREKLSGTPICPADALLPLHPAEELADLRRQISRLRKRESELREAFLSCEDPDMLEGSTHRVVIKTTRAKVFDTSLLPPVIQSDPRFFTTREQTRVCVLPMERLARRQGVFSGMGIPYRPEADDIEVLEPFSAMLRKA